MPARSRPLGRLPWAVLGIGVLSALVGLLARFALPSTVLGQKFLNDYAGDFAWVPLGTLVLVGITMPLARTTVLPRRAVQAIVVGLTTFWLFMEYCQLHGGFVPEFDHPANLPERVANWMAAREGSVFSWGDLVAYVGSGVLTYIFIERSSLCQKVGERPVQLRPATRLSRGVAALLVVPLVILPLSAEGNKGGSARADTSSEQDSGDAAYGCSSQDIKNAKSYAKSRMKKYKWRGQFGALEKLWFEESKWCYKAENPTSGACGIPQALPCSKISNPGSYRSQIDWGLGYIKGRYDNPKNAWNFWQCTSSCKVKPGSKAVLKTGKKGGGPKGHWYMIRVPTGLLSRLLD